VQRDELGHCIRAWRDRLDPAAADLSAGIRRRAPGLRREELASLAGVSVDYLSRLEQGRAANPSPPVPAALARTYPDDERPAALIADLRAGSEAFEELWARRPVAIRAASRKTLEHPEVGPITVDCDVLEVAASDLRLIVYSAAPGTPDAEKLALLGVVGLQRIAG
jgi:transcriptional regulator with XRE-family HTH domain